MYVCVHVHMCACVRVCACAHVYVYVCMCGCVCVFNEETETRGQGPDELFLRLLLDPSCSETRSLSEAYEPHQAEALPLRSLRVLTGARVGSATCRNTNISVRTNTK